MSEKIARTVRLAVVLLGLQSLAQQTTNTNCNIYARTADCTSISTTNDSSAQQAEQREAYEARKSYERAYKVLKNSGQLSIYSK
jgi:hypothetical protein